MDAARFKALMTAGESDRMEWKASLDLDEARRAICALANDLGGSGREGYFVIGIDNKTGKPTGHLNVNDDLLLKIANERGNGKVLPLPSMDVEATILEGKTVVVVAVQPSPDPPVRASGVVYVRVGPSTRQASPADEVKLTEKRRYKNLPFDHQPVVDATLDDLDLKAIERDYLPSAISRDVLRENGRALKDQVASLRLTSANGHPTNAGLLLFGVDVERWFPGAYVQFVRHEGKEIGGPIKLDSRVSGNLATQAPRLLDLLKSQVGSKPSMHGGIRVDVPEYPLQALREIVFNALIHRSYEGTNAPVRINWFDNRVEVQSPGGLYGAVTQETFGAVTDYRNPTLAEGMRNLSFVEKFGVGISTAEKALKENGNPPLEVSFAPHHVLITLRRVS